MTAATKNIYQRINDVIKTGVYTKRGSAGQGTGALYDEVIATIRPLLADNGIVFNTEKAGESRSRANAKGNYIYESDFNVHYINIDDPTDRFTTFVEAHAMDAGDKAPGKAITYATKISLIKVFQIETGLNDESREEVKEKSKTVSLEQIDELSSYCIFLDDQKRPQWTPIGLQLTKSYKIKYLSELLASNFDSALKRCDKAANNANN